MESFYFLKHGQTDWNAKGLLIGQQDIPLNELGRRQAFEAAKILAGHEPASICYSPLARAKETAFIVAEECPCSLYGMSGFAERCWGKWEGKAATQMLIENVEENLPADAERYVDFKNRVLADFSKVLEYPQPILFVSHSAVMRIILHQMGIDEVDSSRASLIHVFEQLGKWTVEIMHA
jgi:broad specificity phosphatase PhoE